MTSLCKVRDNAAGWLSQGISPRRLALTLALGIAIGCLPVFGITTALCAVLAVTLRLNLPALQAANYAVMPLQLLLIAPFVRMGGWLFAAGPRPYSGVATMTHLSPMSLAGALTGMAGQALAAWLVFAIPAVAVLTLALTPVLRKVPALAAENQIAEPAA